MLKKAVFIGLAVVLMGIVSSSGVNAQYCTCGDLFCDWTCSETSLSCPADCGPPTYTISGTVYIDTNGNGVQNFGESGYNSGFSQIVGLSDGDSDATNISGGYNFSGKTAGNYTVTLNVPAGYIATTTNPRSIFVNSNTTVNFGMRPVYAISGKVFVDTNGNGVQNCSGACNNGPGDELNYSGATVNVGGVNTTTNASGNYSRTSLLAGSYAITLTVPAGYTVTTTNPLNVSVGPDSANNNFGINVAPPDCPGGISISDSTPDAGGTATVSVSSCDDVEDPDDGNPPPPFDWDPPGGDDPECSDGINNDGDGLIDAADPDCHVNGDPTQPYVPTDDSEDTPSNTCSDGGTGTPTNTSTSSTATYTAPACPSTPLSCQISIDVSGPGGTTNYTTNALIDETYSITANIRSVDNNLPCTSTSGDPYTDSVFVNTTGGNLPVGGTTQNTTTGSTVFACLISSDYTVTLSVPSGYALIDRSGGADSGINGISFTGISADQTANFCIAPIDPWFQTTSGNARFVNLTNPVPSGQYGSTSVNYPGIFYSSESNAQFGLGSASQKNWVVNDEYSFNAETQNRNGGFSYSFYKAKAGRDGVTIRSISSGTLDWGQIDPSSPNAVGGGGTGIYEVTGDLTVSSSPPAAIFNAANKSRVTLLVSGDVRIEAPITIPVGQGVLIIAAKRDMTIDSDIGTPDPIGAATLNEATTHLDGYYTAEGDVILESLGDSCSDGTTSDRRLNVGGVLIANSLKPFASAGLGTVQNRRSLCVFTQNYPPLYVTSRPDFLIQLTDFYKTSYSKWKEINP